ncbi:hypothetical protein H8356DRAFT_1621548 [Neocallimastix lanati (nom. inval.)]|nr:hypothetical protein H8356DRAFT_1621548 [Neocallimastix sp. JGI-2020a]
MEKDCYTCFICWDSFSLSDEKEKNRVISCCHCTHRDYKYAHIDCLKYWVKSSKGNNKRCNICCAPYMIQKSGVPLTTLIKKHWVMAICYLLLLLTMGVISINSWAKYMIPAIVYIVVPHFNNETYQLETDNNNISVVYVNSEFLKKVYVFLQTFLFIIISFYVGKTLLTYVEKKSNTHYLIGISPTNQMVLVDIQEDEKEDLKEEKEKIGKSKITSKFFSFIEKKFSFGKDNNSIDKFNITMV